MLPRIGHTEAHETVISLLKSDYNNFKKKMKILILAISVKVTFLFFLCAKICPLFLKLEWVRFPLFLFYRQGNDAGYLFWTEEQKEGQWEVCVDITIFLHHALLNLLLRNVISCFFRVRKVMKRDAINQREKFHKYVFWCWYHHILNLKRFWMKLCICVFLFLFLFNPWH